ncbi:hypothetical protein AB0L49_45955 [Streptomyces antimycoticus]|uniref:hypothetical protein n=1 Tax=Streptomyces TaxID=1883 RepID=UPI00117CBD7B|nr:MULTISPECIES: hypothetical protein [Streptomyces]MCQ4203588.1 hypothetical protein [Streptomyces coelicoflavus]
MKLHDLLGTSDGCAVPDSFALYEIAVGHSSAASSVKAAMSAGELRLVIPAVTFAVSCAMRTCWDEYCTKSHQSGVGTAVQGLLGRGGVELLELTPQDAASAGKLYARSVDRHIEGPEVLAACHSSYAAGVRNAPLLSTGRASYCYAATLGEAERSQIRLI